MHKNLDISIHQAIIDVAKEIGVNEMSIKDIDLNKDGVTLGDHMENLKKGVTNLFDGDDTNSNNVIDRVSHQMTGSVTEEKLNKLIGGSDTADTSDTKEN